KRLACRLHIVVDEISPRVAETDEAYVLDTHLVHLLDDDADHQRGRLRHRDRPGSSVYFLHERHGRQGDHRYALLCRDTDHGGRCRSPSRAEQNVDLVFFNQLARILGCGGRIRTVLELNDPDFLAPGLTDVGVSRIDPSPVRNADRGDWTTL